MSVSSTTWRDASLDHADGRGGAFTRKYRLNTLVHVEEFQYVDEAIAREKQIKGWRRSK